MRHFNAIYKVLLTVLESGLQGVVTVKVALNMQRNRHLRGAPLSLARDDD